jgi:hypothetical protein
METIKGITNSGKEVSIIPWGVQENGNYKVTLYIDGLNSDRPYYYPNEGYLHLCDIEYTEKEIEAIQEITKYYFARKIEILTDIREIDHQIIIDREKTIKERIAEYFKNLFDCFFPPEDVFAAMFGQPTKRLFKLNFKKWSNRDKVKKYIYKSVDILVPIKSLHIGGSFQRYFHGDNSWLSEAEALKGEKIYLA